MHKKYGIAPEVTLIFADFSVVEEVQSAPATPAQDMSLLAALALLTYLTPTGVAAEVEEAPAE
jgi:hypothetical protein